MDIQSMWRILGFNTIFIIEATRLVIAKLNNEGRTSVCDHWLPWCLIEIQPRHGCAFRKLHVERDCVQMTCLWKIQSYIEVENLNSRVSFGSFFPSAKSKEISGYKVVILQLILHPSWIMIWNARMSERKTAVEKYEINLDMTYILYTESRFVKALERNLGGCRHHDVEAFSLAVDISGCILFKDIPLLFKARRYKNTRHRMRVVHTKTHTIGRYSYMGISMKVTKAKSGQHWRLKLCKMPRSSLTNNTLTSHGSR